MFLVSLMVSVEPILEICAVLLFGCSLPEMLGVPLIQHNKEVRTFDRENQATCDKTWNGCNLKLKTIEPNSVLKLISMSLLIFTRIRIPIGAESLIVWTFHQFLILRY